MTTYTLGVEFTANSFTNVTADCLQCNITRSISGFNRPLAVPAANFVIDNDDARYTPRNTTSPLYPNMTVGKRVRLTVTEAGTTYHLFNGSVVGLQVNPVLGGRTIGLYCEDDLARLFDKPISLSVVDKEPLSTLFSRICLASGVQSYSSDTINDYTFAGYAYEAPANELLKKIVNNAYHWVIPRGTGNLHLKSRSTTVIQTTVVASYSEYFSLNYDLRKSDIINSVTIKSIERKSSAVSTAVVLKDGDVVLPAGNNSLILSHIDPVTSERNAPFRNTYVQSASFTDQPGTGTDYTSVCSIYTAGYGATTVASIYNGSGKTLYIDSLLIKGIPYQLQNEASFTAVDSASQQKYGVSGFSQQNDLVLDHSFISEYDDFILQRHSENIDRIKIGLKNVYPDILSNELGDLIHVVNTHTAINNTVIITAVDHSIDLNSGIEHTVVYEVDFWTPGVGFVLGVGRLGVNRLGF